MTNNKILLSISTFLMIISFIIIPLNLQSFFTNASTTNISDLPKGTLETTLINSTDQNVESIVDKGSPVIKVLRMFNVDTSEVTVSKQIFDLADTNYNDLIFSTKTSNKLNSADFQIQKPDITQNKNGETVSDILESQTICKLVDSGGISEIWVYTRETGFDKNYNIYYSGVLNIESETTLPKCTNEYKVFKYYFSNLENTSELRASFLKSRVEDFSTILKKINTNFYDVFTGANKLVKSNDSKLELGCGSVDFSPNSISPVSFASKEIAVSRCQTMFDLQTQNKFQEINCQIWNGNFQSNDKSYNINDCINDFGLSYYSWWLQALPGRFSNLSIANEKIQNLWTLIDSTNSSKAIYYNDANLGGNELTSLFDSSNSNLYLVFPVELTTNDKKNSIRITTKKSFSNNTETYLIDKSSGNIIQFYLNEESRESIKNDPNFQLFIEYGEKSEYLNIQNLKEKLSSLKKVSIQPLLEVLSEKKVIEEVEKSPNIYKEN